MNLSNNFKFIANRMFKRLGFVAISLSEFGRLMQSDADAKRFHLLMRYVASRQSQKKASNIEKVIFKSQLGQDLFVLMVNEWKRNGFFVEFGATDGIALSNTWTLEKYFGWNGILAEPGRSWQSALRWNRQAKVSDKAVWESSGLEINFQEAKVLELSSVQQTAGSDMHGHFRRGKEYSVETISLIDLLEEFDAPKEIDFLSIDTEGSELEIIRGFPFDSYSFKVICIEHNYNQNRDEIFRLLNKSGYKRVMQDYSLFDDWYVKNEIANKMDWL